MVIWIIALLIITVLLVAAFRAVYVAAEFMKQLYGGNND